MQEHSGAACPLAADEASGRVSFPDEDITPDPVQTRGGELDAVVVASGRHPAGDSTIPIPG